MWTWLPLVATKEWSMPAYSQAAHKKRVWKLCGLGVAGTSLCTCMFCCSQPLQTRACGSALLCTIQMCVRAIAQKCALCRQVRQVLAEADENEDNVIQYKEFLPVMVDILHSLKAKQEAHLLREQVRVVRKLANESSEHQLAQLHMMQIKMLCGRQQH